MNEGMRAKNQLLLRKRHSKIKINRFVILLLSTSLITFFTIDKANADTVTNDNYSIDVNSIDTNPQPTPIKQQVLGTKDIEVSQYVTGPDYNISAQSNTLTLTISQNTIDYGILSSTNPVIRNSNIQIHDNLLGAEVLAYENHSLASNTNDLIPNTSCDNGTCTPEIAAAWTNALTYGFGYRCDSQIPNLCDVQFSTPYFFKSFPDKSSAHAAEPIMISGKGNSQAIITYKVNISGTQKAGGYYNSITYLAIPNF